LALVAGAARDVDAAATAAALVAPEALEYEVAVTKIPAQLAAERAPDLAGAAPRDDDDDDDARTDAVFELAGRCAIAAPALSCTIGELAPATEYMLRARARSSEGWGRWSARSMALSAHTVAERGCLRLSDHTLVLTQRRGLHAALDRCSKDCWAAGDCVSRCVSRAGVSARCASCFGEVSACTKKHCLDRCALDPDGPPCRECSRTACMGDYARCVGVPEALVP